MNGIAELQIRARQKSAKDDVYRVLCLLMLSMCQDIRDGKSGENASEGYEFFRDSVVAIKKRYELTIDQVLEIIEQRDNLESVVKYASENNLFDNLVSSQ